MPLKKFETEVVSNKEKMPVTSQFIGGMSAHVFLSGLLKSIIEYFVFIDLVVPHEKEKIIL